MPVSPTYPGVYVEEVPSGVHTITGVGTSTALFIGMTKQGRLNVPKLCLSLNDFVRSFSMDTSQGDMPRAVNLFYANGGTQAWIMRIADSTAASASVQLFPEVTALGAVLKVTAISAGLYGNTIRLAVTYNQLDPEGTFNLQVFAWVASSRGGLTKSGTENYTNLSMDPNAPNYCVSVVNSASLLVNLQDVAVHAFSAPGTNGVSRSGRPITHDTDATFVGLLKALVSTTPSQFQMSVDGGPFVTVDVAGVLGAVATNTPADIITLFIQPAINMALGATGLTATATWDDGPKDANGKDTLYLRITSGNAAGNGSIRIVPAAANDIAVAWMLGPPQGGLQVSPYAPYRPLPTGVTMRLAQTGPPGPFSAVEVPPFPIPAGDQDNTITFGGLKQTAFGTLGIGSKNVNFNLVTNSTANAVMFMDGSTTTLNGNSDGVREKLNIIANAINAAAASDATLTWQGSVVGDRLVITAQAGGDTATTPVTSSADATFGNFFEQNVQYYSLSGGSDGNAPQLSDYQTAFGIIDKQVDLFNIMVLPSNESHTNANALALNGPASTFCQQRRAVLLVDSPFGGSDGWTDMQSALAGVNAVRIGVVKDTSALYFPRLQIVEGAGLQYVGASGAVAGIMARIDGTRGVWKAPAGTEADVRGIVGVEQRFSDNENGVLNPHAINVIRVFSDGIVVWGARTMDGDDDFGSEYKYVPVRRLAYFLEESLVRGLKWVVFEPNAEPLWAQIRLNVGSFMHEQFRKGAFAGTTASTAYFVRCDSSTTTQADQNAGIVNIIVGFAPLEPAEFVVIQLQQMAGQLAT